MSRKRRRFRRLYEKYSRALHAQFFRWGFSKEDARDLTQVTFLRVFNGMKAYRGEAEWAYIITIANRVRLNDLRYRHAQSRGADIGSLEDLVQLPEIAQYDPLSGEKTATPEELALEREQFERRQRRILKLRQEINNLPPRMRRCLLMRLDDRLKYREIAVAMDSSMDAVKTLLFQARKRLKEAVGEWTDEQLSSLNDDPEDLEEAGSNIERPRDPDQEG